MATNKASGAELRDDLEFVGVLQEHWLRQIEGLGISPESAASLLGKVNDLLLGARLNHGVGADDLWRALLRGYAEYGTLAYFEAQGVEVIRRHA